MDYGDRYKKEFVRHIKDKLNVANFTGGFRDKKFNIFVDQDLKQRLP